MARGSFHWDDPFLLDEQLTDEEKMVREAARDYAPIRAGDIGYCPAEALEIGCTPT